MTWRKPMPDSAKMVFKGEIFEVWQWPQKMYDGSTVTFERLRRPDTAVIVPTTEDNNVIVLDQEQPDTDAFISMPSGRCDEGEEPFATAKRELREETGYESDNWEPFMEVRPSGKIEWTIYVYLARNCKKVAEPDLDGGEKIDVRTVSFGDFLQLADEPNFRSPELTETMLRARLDPVKKEELRKKLFGE